MAPDVFAEGLYHLGMLYSCRLSMGDADEREAALIGVERNHSSGQSVLRWLMDKSYPRLYRKRAVNVVGERKPTIAYGFTTDANSRRLILDNLAALIREGTSGISSQETVREARTFVLAEDGKPQAQEGSHDDRIMSYAIALEMERFHSHGASATTWTPKVAPTPTGV